MKWGYYYAAVGAVVGGWLALNTWTMVPVGEHKVEVCMSEVTGKVLPNGLHAVTPWCSYDKMNTQNQMVEWDRMLIPTQDRMNSYASVVLKYRLNSTGLAKIRNDFGNETRYFEKTVYQQLPSIIKSEGRKLADSAELANDSALAKLAMSAQTRLQDTVGQDIEIQEVLIKNVEFDPLIYQQIKETKKRTEEEKREKSQLRIEETKLQKQVAAAEAQANSAEHQMAARKHLADAKLYEQQQLADGSLYRQKLEADALLILKEKEAEGMAAINAQLTPEYMEFMDRQATLTESQRWDGKRTLTHQYVPTVPVSGN